MGLNRKLQRQVLRSLEEVYPDSLLVAVLPGYSDSREFMANLFYLREHGLIEGGDIREPGRCRSMIDAQITATGLDFLEDDGGPPAIIGSGFIRFNRCEIVEAIEQSLGQEGLTARERSRMAFLDGEALKDVVTRLMQDGACQNRELLSAPDGNEEDRQDMAHNED